MLVGFSRQACLCCVRRTVVWPASLLLQIRSGRDWLNFDSTPQNPYNEGVNADRMFGAKAPLQREIYFSRGGIRKTILEI